MASIELLSFIPVHGSTRDLTPKLLDNNQDLAGKEKHGNKIDLIL
jgi:hypothetical protein